MTQNNFGKHADALEALASGKDLSVQPPAAPADALENVLAVTPQQQALDSLSGGKPAANDALSDLAGQSAGAAGVANGGFPNEFAAAGPAFPRPVRSAKAVMAMRKANSSHYKQSMVPVLAVVGCLLLAFSLFTIGALATAGEDPNALAAEGTYFNDYGMLFVVVSLPMGAILLLGSWLFHAESKKRR